MQSAKKRGNIRIATYIHIYLGFEQFNELPMADIDFSSNKKIVIKYLTMFKKT